MLTKPSNQSFSKSIGKLAKYVKKAYHFKVEISPKAWTDEIYFYPQKIVLAAFRNKELQLYSLLHEIGHLLLSRQAGYTMLYPRVNNVNGRGQAYNIECVREESRAWEIGYMTAKRKNIKVRDKQYWKYANCSLCTYIKDVKR